MTNESFLKSNKHKTCFIIFSVFLVFFIIFVTFNLANPKTIIAPQDIKKVSLETDKPAFTPFPFQEMTIPYLRSRNFESTLAGLSQYSSSKNYTSYLTSYSSDGFTVNGLITIPTQEPPKEGYPAIIFVHGYIPPTLYRTEQNYASYVDYFARNGFVVFKIDLRGHDKSEGIASGAYYSGDYVIDVLNAVSAIRKVKDIDLQRIGLWGHSMAGNVIFRSLVVDTSITKAVIWAGAVYTYDDFSEFGIDDTSYRPPSDNSERERKREELFNLYGRYDPKSWFWQQVPATNFLDGVETSVQVHHAVNDTVVNIEYSRNLMKILENTKISHELFEYASGGHNLTGSAFNQAMQKSVEFFLE